jgi:hypothetical protein
VHNDAGSASRLALREARLFEYGDVDPRSREHVRDRATQRSAANDRDLNLQVSAVPRIGRPTG